MGVATSTPGPLARVAEPRGRRAPGWAWPVALSVFLVLLGALLVHYGFRLWIHSYDEDVYRVTGRLTWDGFPSSLWGDTWDGRGLQRLQAWVLGFGIGIFGTPTGFKVVRLVDIAAYLATAWPVWLWVRAFGVGRALSAAAAALAVFVPWAIVTTTFMTESLAYPLATLALFCSWRVATRPGRWWLLAAVAAIFAATLARSVMLLLGPIMVVTLVLVVVRFDARGAWASRRTWTAKAVAPWALLGLAILATIAVYALHRSTLNHFTGVYTNQVSINLPALPRLMREDFSTIASGIGILPAIVAVAWMGRDLVRPSGPEGLALTIMTVLLTVFAAYGTMRGGPDERYMMYLAPPLIVGAAVAVSRRQLGPISLGLATAFVLWLFSGVHWSQASDAFAFYVSASEVFHGRVLLLGLHHRLPDVGFSAALWLGLGIAGAMALAAVAFARRDRIGTGVAVALGVGLAGLQLAQVVYLEQHFTRLANFGASSLTDRTWVDRAIGENTHYGVFVERTGPDVNNLYEVWREVAFFNQAQRTMFQAPGSTILDPLYGANTPVAVDDRTGLLSAAVPLPHIMMELTFTPKWPLAGQKIVDSDYLPFRLVRTGGPPRLQWLVSGNDDASWTIPGQATRVRVFKHAGTGDCLTFGVQAPPGATANRTMTVRSGGRRYRTVVPPGGGQLAGVRLTGGTADAFSDVSIEVQGADPVLGAPRGVRLAIIERTACP